MNESFGSKSRRKTIIADSMPTPIECGIQVFCRFRPLNEVERENGSSVVHCVKSKEVVELGGAAYMFDGVFDTDATQGMVYGRAAQHIVQDVLSGYNGTIMAYGQTSSGKTHTMEGSLSDTSLFGLVPRIVHNIFQHIKKMTVENEIFIKVSYFEIYNERIRDLLDPARVNLAIGEDKNRKPYVKNLTEKFVTNENEVFDLIEIGKKNRREAVTNLNEHSSRSHAVFLIKVEQVDRKTEKKLSGKLYLVDLAGSEKVSKTSAEGTVLEEAKNINKSLSELGNVIAAFFEKKPHVPYRNSKLTRVLQESLGGNSRTTIMICCSPASVHESETKSTILFGLRAKTIKNVVAANEELSAEEWKRRFENELNKLAAAQHELIQWRNGTIILKKDWIRLDCNEMEVDDDSSSFETGEAEITESERKVYENEKENLCQQLDEKDQEISSLSQLAKSLQQEIAEKEEASNQCRTEYYNSLALYLCTCNFYLCTKNTNIYIRYGIQCLCLTILL